MDKCPGCGDAPHPGPCDPTGEAYEAWTRKWDSLGEAISEELPAAVDAFLGAGLVTPADVKAGMALATSLRWARRAFLMAPNVQNRAQYTGRLETAKNRLMEALPHGGSPEPSDD